MSLNTMIASLGREVKRTMMDLTRRDWTVDLRSFSSPQSHETAIENRLENLAAGETLQRR